MTQRVTLNRVVSLLLADHFALGWQRAVILELEAMRREFPDAETLELRLVKYEGEDQPRPRRKERS